MGGAMDPDRVVLAGVLAVVVAVLLLLAGRIREAPEVRALRRDVREARVARRTARGSRGRAIGAARTAVRRARREHERAVRRLTERVRSLEHPIGRAVSRLGQVALHERALVVPGTSLPLEDLRIDVGVSGGIERTRRPTLTRAALGAAAFGAIGALGSFALQKRETTDTRQVHLLVDSAGSSMLIDLDRRSQAAAHRFADAVRRAVAAAPAREASRRAALDAARVDLAAARADTSDLVAALAELDRVVLDPGLATSVTTSEEALRAARAALRAARRAGRERG